MYPEYATITKNSLPEAPNEKKDKGKNNDKTNATHEATKLKTAGLSFLFGPD